MSASNYAIIVAGGSGIRMGYDIPKQFILLAGEPVLMHTIRIFENLENKPKIILVLPHNQINAWKDLCVKHNFIINHEIVSGGDTRFQSVKNGLTLVKSDGLVAIHDGVRPLVSKDVVENCFIAAEEYGAAIPVIKPVESVRMADRTGSYPIDRENVYLVQTPQVFQASIIKKCYETHWQPSFTDDASVVEFCGKTVHLVEGNRENIKITSPFDLGIAEILIKQKP
ncbi:MAG: 2-C-methyl-D-erythritol 4-phosphate cytidylyltransferase [Tenuifilaceae bacterium]